MPKIDFLRIGMRSTKKGLEIYPKFVIGKTKDLMVRGGDFYAVWLEELGLWSTDEQDCLDLIDREIDIYVKENPQLDQPHVLHMWDAETGMIDHWHKFVQKQMRDNFHMLDETLIFSNDKPTKEDYASKRLNYPLQKGSIEAYDKLMDTLYSPEERHKIEWAIGSIVSGDSKKIQKFLVLYGAAGTGKSTVLNIVQKLFDGYYSVFDAKALGTSSNSFALEAFKTNPLVAIQHDGDLSRIEDNTRLNSLVSHELMTVNEKFKSTYSNRFKAFLFMGTNKPVKITDGRSGLIRRLIDVSPTGKKVPAREYKELVKKIDFELGAIAQHCLDIYKSDPGYYDAYIPSAMMGASNDFYNFVEDSFYIFKRDDEVTLQSAYAMYNEYCTSAKVAYPMSRRAFKEELKSYFWEFKERGKTDENGKRPYNVYSGFRVDIFEEPEKAKEEVKTEIPDWLKMDIHRSLLDEVLAEESAQYANEDEHPSSAWAYVKTKLQELDTSMLHYVRVPLQHIVIDFDLKDSDGKKSLALNLKAASKWPATYAELSKSGAGVHLHYIYDGDPTKLEKEYGDNIEIKVFRGKSALRRRLTKCNDIQIAHLSSGLPLKKEVKKVAADEKEIKTNKGLHTMIKKCLNKEYGNTAPSVSLIKKILDDAYEGGVVYNVEDLHDDIRKFASKSNNQSERCLKMVAQMKFKSDNWEEKTVEKKDRPIVFFDIEVFPNLFLINWKKEGKDHDIHRMVNPSAQAVEDLCENYNLVGFNNRRYDNHIVYAAGYLGYSVPQLYRLSHKIVSGDRNAYIAGAYGLSYTDIYDYSTDKKSLKKWEIELGIHHQELGLPWDEPVDKELWDKVSAYCDNDVIATEAVWNATREDFIAREILADLADATVNDSTNTLTRKIIFGDEREPQSEFNYRFMGDVPPADECYCFEEPGLKQSLPGDYSINKDFQITNNAQYNVFDIHTGKPWFPGYKFECGKSEYRGEDPKEGGYVYAEPGIHYDVALLDIASMHPSSVIAEQLFGKYTKRFEDLVQIRLHIKHKEFDIVRSMFGGKLAKYLDDEAMAKKLGKALKIPINSVYGLTSASFKNAFRDDRNIDNIVAKRGALFMINLKHEVQDRGYTVAHIKTDSIKIPEADMDIIGFVNAYGKEYGYTFEHEATYEKMCLVNDAVYVAKYASQKFCLDRYGYLPGDNAEHAGQWTNTGKQFQVPYVFKKLFTGEEILFEDMCETRSVSTAMYLDLNEKLPDVSEAEKAMDILETKYKKGTISDTTFEKESTALANDISAGHNYKFIGKVGSFCPIKPGKSGGVLLREQSNGKFSSVNDTKGYRWLDAETVRLSNSEKDIDISYYDYLCDKACDAIRDLANSDEEYEAFFA